ncbi:unnamed protein product [Rhizoctonia solani]|uniref:Transmembrane protein n=1 Tax=Rhizoctonia solani TaxID=456999 RepID=A0A8H3HEH3_9AGAM|nr:unnamed protein product [Rhizoctonia solani]CAE6502447.1 unnamed protein product [Rhizoctonia solani]
MDEPKRVPFSPRVSQASSSSDGTVYAKVYEPVQIVKVERDRQEVTVEGFRTLGIVSTFIAGVESQCLGLVSGVPDDKNPRLREAVSALLLTGLLLSSFGAALSLLSARWFDLLRDKQLTMLEYRWECARNNRKSADLEKQPPPQAPEKIQGEVNPKWNLRDFLVAKAIGLALPVVFCGFYTFIVGMVLYTWMAHSLIAAVVNTVIAALGSILLVFMHLDFDFMGALSHMSFQRIRI